MQIDLSSAVSFDNKVAGHDGVLQDASGSVIIKPATTYEIEFYEQLAAQHPSFAAVVPRFYGTLELSGEQGGGSAEEKGADGSHKIKDAEKAIVLENVTSGFVRPSVVDIKLGRQLWDARASAEKAARLDAVAAATTSGSLGFRIAGMKVWDSAKAEFVVYDKNYGRRFAKEDVVEGFREFLPESVGERRREITRRIVEEVGRIAEVLEGEESRMYSASLLIVYEGDGEAYEEAKVAREAVSSEEEEEEEIEVVSETVEIDGRTVEQVSFASTAEVAEVAGEEDEDEEEKEVLKVKVIDFAHATWVPGQGKDVNMLEGVYNVRKLFEQLL
ncbi:inositol polyphosphate kinase-domain-containing protein [Myxozyma melibiosi]|uniref:Kinase n=1 Tax=Myxozyma melibiosi TaxID=54550 RepID=A0ABR1EXT1_9ASCO